MNTETFRTEGMAFRKMERLIKSGMIGVQVKSSFGKHVVTWMTFEEQTDLVESIRKETGEGMMICLKALKESKWDRTKAIEYLKSFGNI